MRSEIIVMGASAGGLAALGTILGILPSNFALPIVVVQHRSTDSRGLVREMRKYTALNVREPNDKEPVRRECLYLAPADYHLLLEPGEFRLSTEGPINYARPSIDVLFQSAADAYGSRTVGVVLTGANSDGTEGAATIKHARGIVVVQNPDEAQCPFMPRSVLNAVRVDHVLSLEEIGSYLVSLHIAANIRGASSGNCVNDPAKTA